MDSRAGSIGSIVLDANNNPHISYTAKISDDRGNSSLMYTSWNGSTWNIEIVDSTVDVAASSLGLDSDDNPRIVYSAGLNPGTLKYASWNGSKWNIESVDSEGGSASISLVLDSLGNPHISYQNKGIRYAFWTGSGWSLQMVDPSLNTGGTSLELDLDGNPHISYFVLPSTGGYNVLREIKYAHWNGSNWDIQTIGLAEGSSSLALDSNSNPHVSFTNSSLYYASWNGQVWNIQLVDSAEVSLGQLVLDPLDNPHISYQSSAGANASVKYAFWMGSQWSIETLNASEIVSRSSLALDSENNPHISYVTHENLARLGDLMYAVSIESVTSQPFNFPVTIFLVFSVVSIVIILAFVAYKSRKRSTGKKHELKQGPVFESSFLVTFSLITVQIVRKLLFRVF